MLSLRTALAMNLMQRRDFANRFGPSEQVLYGEFDGWCTKRVAVKLIGE